VALLRFRCTGPTLSAHFSPVAPSHAWVYNRCHPVSFFARGPAVSTHQPGHHFSSPSSFKPPSPSLFSCSPVNAPRIMPPPRCTSPVSHHFPESLTHNAVVWESLHRDLREAPFRIIDILAAFCEQCLASSCRPACPAFP